MPWRTPLSRFRGLSPSRSIPGRRSRSWRCSIRPTLVHPVVGPSARLRRFSGAKSGCPGHISTFASKSGRSRGLPAGGATPQVRRSVPVCCSCCGPSLKLWDWRFLVYGYIRRDDREPELDPLRPGNIVVDYDRMCRDRHLGLALQPAPGPTGGTYAPRWSRFSSLRSSSFFHSQLAAVIGLTVNVLIYASLTFVANLEAGDADVH